MRHLLIVLAAVMLFSSAAEARVWRPAGRRPISGDYREVIGDNIKIRTKRSNESVPYVDLADEDREYVRSQLRRRGQESEIERLDKLLGIEPAAGDGAAEKSDEEESATDGDGMTPDPGSGSGDAQTGGNTRNWTDIHGNSISAEFISATAFQVTLRLNGQQQTFPLVGFSPEDRQWISEQTGSPGFGWSTDPISARATSHRS